MVRLIAIALALVSFSALADEYVRGYTRRDGTYVAPHFRSTPNDTKLDNYSTRGNVNPYTGKRGTVDPFAPRVPSVPSYPSNRSYSPPSTLQAPQPLQPLQVPAPYDFGRLPGE